MQIISNNNAPVAQGIEQLPSKQWVRGSIPRGRAITLFLILNLFFLIYSTVSSAEEPLKLFLGGNEKEAINETILDNSTEEPCESTATATVIDENENEDEYEDIINTSAIENLFICCTIL